VTVSVKITPTYLTLYQVACAGCGPEIYVLPLAVAAGMHAELYVLLTIYMLARAVDELGYELHHRPDWVELPLQGILQLMGRRTPP
jgi:predicted trehalose synthase